MDEQKSDEEWGVSLISLPVLQLTLHLKTHTNTGKTTLQHERPTHNKDTPFSQVGGSRNDGCGAIIIIPDNRLLSLDGRPGPASAGKGTPERRREDDAGLGRTPRSRSSTAWCFCQSSTFMTDIRLEDDEEANARGGTASAS